MLCRVHHRLIHYSGWTVQIRDGLPEFIPPAWIDAGRRPRRRSGPVITTDDTGQVRGARVANFDDTG